MKRLLVILLVPAFGLTFGCVEPPEKTGEEPTFCDGTSCEELPGPELSGVFVSGHLGNYRDCPEDAYVGEASGEPAGAGRVAPEGDIAEGACAEGETCTPILNCETASATINLSNDGEGIATGVQVDRVELYNSLGELVATLPVMDVASDGGAFSGELDASATTSLRIDFQGPQNPYSLLNTSDPSGDASFEASSSGTIRVIVTSDNDDELAVEGKGVYAVPSVDT